MVDAHSANDEYPQIDQLIGENTDVKPVIESTAGATYEGFSEEHNVHLLTIAPKRAYEIQRTLSQSGISPEATDSTDQKYPDVEITNSDQWVYSIREQESADE